MARSTGSVGLAYYTSYPDKIDAWIADAMSERAERAWRQQQELLG